MTDFTRLPGGGYDLGNGDTFVRDPNGNFHLEISGDDSGSSTFKNDGTDLLNILDVSTNTNGDFRLSNGNLIFTGASQSIEWVDQTSTSTWTLGLTGTGIAQQLNLTLSEDGRQFSEPLSISWKTGAVTFGATPIAPTPAITDNSTNIANTSWVNSFVSSFQGVKNGDISTVGSSLTLELDDIDLLITLTSTSTTGAQITYQATSGSIIVDVRRVTVYGASGVETNTIDGGTISTTPTVIDSLIYTQSNDSSAHFIRVGGIIYIVTVWISGSGSRASLIYRKVI